MFKGDKNIKVTEQKVSSNRWEFEKLGNLANYLNGRAFKPEDWGTTGLPIIRIDQMNNPNTKHDYYNGQVDEDNLLQNGDLLFSWSATLKVMIWNRGKAVLNQHIFKVVPKNKIMKLYFYHLLNYNLDTLAGHSHGSTMKHIKKSDLVKFKVPLPPLPEQRRIATILSTLDETVEHTEVLIEKYRNIKAGLMADLLTRGIDEEGRIRSEDTHRFKDSALGRVPEEWEVGTLSDIAQINPKSDISKFSDNSLVTFLSMPDVGENGKIISRQIRKLSEVKTGFTRFTEDDILFAKITPCMENGKGALATELINKAGFGSTEFHVLRAKQSGSPEFIYHVTQSKKFRLKSEGNMTGSAGQQRVPADFFKKYQISLPPLPEQHRIAEILTAADQRIEKEEAYRNKLLQLKKGLMQDLLTGKVRVKDGSFQMPEQSEN